MSRTDKDRPYWVKTRDEGVAHHDHSRLGEPIWHTKYLTNEDGEKIMERAPYYFRAREVISKWAAKKKPYDYDWFKSSRFMAKTEGGYYSYLGAIEDKVERRNEGEVFTEAFEAVEFGDGTKWILAGTYERQARVQYIAGYVADHCTLDEDEPKGSLYRQYPCYMTWGSSHTFRCSCEMCNPGVNYEGIRREKRDVLRKITKTYNSGNEDWEDEFDSVNLKPSRKSFQSWW